MRSEQQPGPALGDSVVVQVAGLGALAHAAAVLAHHDVVQAQLLHAAQHLHLLVANVLRVQAHLPHSAHPWPFPSRTAACLLTTAGIPHIARF